MAEVLKPVKINDIPHEEFDIDEIEFGIRYREDYGDLSKLKQTILDDGLIQPISVTRNPEGSGYPVKIVAGGRRFKAIQSLKADGHPLSLLTCRVFEEMDDHTLRSLELIENVMRKDMSFFEDAKLKEEIHRLEVSKHGAKFSNNPSDTGHSRKDTAQMLNISASQIQKDAKLYGQMEKLKDVIDFTEMTRSDATRAVKQVLKQATQKVGASKAKKIIGENSDTRLLSLTNAYRIEDCQNGLKKMGASTQNFVEIDPPYAIDLYAKKKGMQDNYVDYNEIDVEAYVPLMRNVFDECWRIMKTDSWLVCWFGPEPWLEIMRYLIEGGTAETAMDLYRQLSAKNKDHKLKPFAARFGNARFKTHRMCGQWIKPSGQTRQPLTRLGNSYESFFYVSKGNPELHKPGRINTFTYSPVPPEQKIHPTERPKELIVEILDTFAQPGDAVTVPFAGSGRTLIEAAKKDMIPTGFDLSQTFKDGYTITLTKEIK